MCLPERACLLVCVCVLIPTTGEGLVVVYTEQDSFNAGRPYCFQVLGPLLHVSEPLRCSDLQPASSPEGDVHEQCQNDCENTFKESFKGRFPVNLDLRWASKFRSKKHVISLRTGKEISVNVHKLQDSNTSSNGAQENGELFSGWTEDLLVLMKELAKQAQQLRMERELSSFDQSRVHARMLFESLPFQCIVAVLISANFLSNAYESEMNGRLVDIGGNPSRTQKFLSDIDLFFTSAFTIELVINMYGHLFWDFFTDGWSIFDLCIVSISLLSLFSPALASISVFRLMRAFRVVRIFGRLKSLRSIINALTASIVPVINAFVIVAIVMMLFSIIGVTIFGAFAVCGALRYQFLWHVCKYHAKLYCLM